MQISRNYNIENTTVLIPNHRNLPIIPIVNYISYNQEDSLIFDTNFLSKYKKRFSKLYLYESYNGVSR